MAIHDRNRGHRVSRRGNGGEVDPPHLLSPTAIAVEALRTGVLSGPRPRREEIPHEDETILVGDPDDHSLGNEYVGDETPGGSASTPDQNGVDEIGFTMSFLEDIRRYEADTCGT